MLFRCRLFGLMNPCVRCVYCTVQTSAALHCVVWLIYDILYNIAVINVVIAFRLLLLIHKMTRVSSF